MSSFVNSVRDRRAMAILIIAVIVIFVPIGVYLEMGVMAAGQTDGCTCFDANSYVPAPVYNGTSQISVKTANQTAMNGTIPSYAQINKQADTITFHSMNISLVVFSNSNTWVSTVTNTTIPEYDNVSSLSNAFAIYGLYQPTLVIPRDATLNVTFINMDFTDHHNFVLTTFPPPFPEYIMQNMAVDGEMVQMTPLIAPVNNSTNTASEFQYTIVLNVPASVTHMWYMCMFPTHAMNGMYGNITLVSPSSGSA